MWNQHHVTVCVVTWSFYAPTSWASNFQFNALPIWMGIKSFNPSSWTNWISAPFPVTSCTFLTSTDNFCIICTKDSRDVFRAYFKRSRQDWMCVNVRGVIIYLIISYLQKREINKGCECLIGLICPILNAPSICPRYNHNAALTELFEGLQLAWVISA